MPIFNTPPKEYLGKREDPPIKKKKEKKTLINGIKTQLAVMIIAMLFISISSTGLVMAKDADRNMGIKTAKVIETTTEEASVKIETNVDAAVERVAVAKVPTVKGLKEEEALQKILDTPKMKKEKVEIKREKLTFEKLVEKTPDIFFGEVLDQIISKENVVLTIVEADTTDELTASMLAMGSRLAWPVPGHESLSSHFGGRKSPGGIGSTNHKGIDIPAPTGTPIIAVKEGKVEKAVRLGGYGNCVVIDHENGFKTLYGHMSVITCNAGDKVKPGDVIGKVGSTGWSTGPHLHFGIMKNEEFIDPEPFFTGKERLEAGKEVSENLQDKIEEENKEQNSKKNTETNDSESKDTTEGNTKETKSTEPETESTTKRPAPASTEKEEKPSTTSPTVKTDPKKETSPSTTQKPATPETQPTTKPQPDPTTQQTEAPIQSSPENQADNTKQTEAD